MRRTTLLLSAFALSAGLWAQSGDATRFNIIPQPNHISASEGSFALTPATTVAANGAEAKQVLGYLQNKMLCATGAKLREVGTKKAPGILLSIDKKMTGAEAYTLEVTPQGVVAKAATGDGLFYAVQTLLQLLPPAVESTVAKTFSSWSVPSVQIADSPRFTYRGVMLDPCRHFLPVEAVKKQIDVLASYKINRLHWHLTEDQGWRIEIKKYPRLTQVGSVRTEGDGSTHRGYYTQQEVKEVVAYARERHIEVVPELEIPGHELAAIAAYPELSCTGKETTPRIIWGVEDVVMCPGRERMFGFLRDVIDEMAPLFPSVYFHIGGDECPRGEWKKCPDCQKRMKELGYTREAQLQSYVIGRVEKYLRTKGKRIIGWDEILEGGNLDTTAIVMSWRGEEGGITAAKAGHQVLMTPSSHGFYFDHYQGDAINEPCAIGGYSTLAKVYGYDPVPAEVHAAGRDNMVLGVQANCWSEYIHTPSQLEYRLYPRALALSEVAWTRPEAKPGFEDFQRRADGDAAERLSLRKINFHIPQPEQPGLACNYLAFTQSDTIALKTTRPLPIVYTTDGTAPTASSLRYTAPIVLDRSTVLRTACVLPCGILSPERTIYADKTDFAPAAKAADTKPGLTLTKWEGHFLRPTQITGEPSVKDSVVTDIEAVRTLADVPADVRGVRDYAARVEGYIDIPATGVYEFSSNKNQVYIDGKLAIDNSGEAVPRYSRNNRQLALEKGLHRVSVTFLGGIFGGWPTYWDNAQLHYRPEGGKWAKVSAEMLCH